ncbi:hypothetical protein F5I97DRAFT_1876017 [Phlebopus sp. FC_14]|nr:hypothetical protein F5I97DRAFT_1876017 [Phlebopus sp. FC_14]
MASAPDAALKEEIARLTGAINRHKSTQQSYGAVPGTSSYRRTNRYVNPNYKPTTFMSQACQIPSTRYSSTAPARSSTTTQVTDPTRDVVIDGVTFESSSRSLVRKDLSKPSTAPSKAPLRPIPQQADFSRATGGHRIPAARAYKSKVSSRSQQRRPRNRNMTLNNTRGSTQVRRANKRIKYLDKPCPRFTTTGASSFSRQRRSFLNANDLWSFHGCSGTCSRGLTCMYQHDPNKIAVCWNFLHGNCSKTAETCNLSHDPTPERTPLCVHFANNGRCTRDNCPFPHVRVGQRHGVCRDFAVLGYCSKGLDCEMQHVRECPDFAEKGTCSTKGCKLPHVIRANRNRKIPASVPSTTATTNGSSTSDNVADNTATSSIVTSGSDPGSSAHVSVQDAQLGDEYISLMFEESDDEDEDEDEEETDEEEGDDPTADDGPEAGPLY